MKKMYKNQMDEWRGDCKGSCVLRTLLILKACEKIRAMHSKFSLFSGTYHSILCLKIEILCTFRTFLARCVIFSVLKQNPL